MKKKGNFITLGYYPNTSWFIPISLVFFCLFSSCKDNAQTPRTEPTEEVEKINKKDFLSFYQKFHEDSLFQLEHIQFPLLSDRVNDSLGDYYHKEDWVLHQPFSLNNSMFDQKFTAMNEYLIVEDIVAPKLNLHMQRRWKKDGERWKLIYYKELQKIDMDTME